MTCKEKIPHLFPGSAQGCEKNRLIFGNPRTSPILQLSHVSRVFSSLDPKVMKIRGMKKRMFFLFFFSDHHLTKNEDVKIHCVDEKLLPRYLDPWNAVF